MRRAGAYAWALAALATTSGCSLLYPFDYGVSRDASVDVAPPSDTTSTDDVADVVLPCAEGTTRCSAGCVDTATSPLHCGRCGAACPARDHATPVCAGGACAFVCMPGYADCDGRAENGCEADTRSSPAHCGRCGQACDSPGHTVAVCAAGTCGVTCATGYGNCNGIASDGCEVNLDNREAHCGACGRACAFANAASSCNDGACELGSCTRGYENCNVLASDGCETNTLADSSNCGACGRACDGGRVCANGSCVASCPTGNTSCMGACVNLSADPRNCMRCGNACPVRPHSVTTCAAGVCGSVCATGFASCDGDAMNGCEVDLAADPSHCGACGRACEFRGARGACAEGLCVFGECEPGRGDCDGASSNGCEVDLQTSTTSCGACGVTCAVPPNATAACRAGTCVINTCTVGFGDCDGARANGCEVDLQTSATNCGACGAVCPAGSACRAGSCVAVCGSDGLPCCSGGGCFGGACILGGCHTLCGSNGQVCCPGQQCGTLRVCMGSPIRSCQPCGAAGQPCCAGNACSGGAACMSGTCR